MAGLSSLTVAPQTLSPENEMAFQRDMQFAPGWRDWRRDFHNSYGQMPNIEPGGDYDYRRAWLYGAAPQFDPVSGTHHGLSAVQAAPYAEPLPLKTPDHPTAWMETFMRQFGVDPRAVAPADVTPEMVEFLRASGIVPTSMDGPR